MNATQYETVGLGIGDEEGQVQPIPIGIGFQFQFQILSHPNSGIGSFTIPIPNPEVKYLHPNGALEITKNMYRRMFHGTSFTHLRNINMLIYSFVVLLCSSLNL